MVELFLLLLFHQAAVFCYGYGGLIGEPCRYDGDCFVDNAFCRLQKVCDCKEGLKISDDGTQCILTIGSNCNRAADCNAIPNTRCIDFQCECNIGYVSDVDSLKCLPVAMYLESQCSEDVQCQKGLGDFSYCHNGVCQCLPYHHLIDGRCIKSKRVLEPCHHSTECFDSKQNSTLTMECLDQKCYCKRGYYWAVSTCLPDSSEQLQSHIVVSISVALFTIYLST